MSVGKDSTAIYGKGCGEMWCDTDERVSIYGQSIFESFFLVCRAAKYALYFSFNLDMQLLHWWAGYSRID